jgi:hypothetical protein
MVEGRRMRGKEGVRGGGDDEVLVWRLDVIEGGRGVRWG